MPERVGEFDTGKRPAQIRRRMLTIARLDGNIHPDRFVPAANFLRAADDQGVPVSGEVECLNLMSLLLEMGLLEEWSPVALGAPRPTFRERRFRLTQKGARLWEQDISPIPGIADDRFGD